MKLIRFSNPTGIYLFKVNNGKTRAISEISSKIIIIILFEKISNIADVSVVDFEQVNASWGTNNLTDIRP